MFPYDERAALLEQCRVSSKKEGLALESAVELWWVGEGGGGWGKGLKAGATRGRRRGRKAGAQLARGKGLGSAVRG
jgi:hypothetical protein